MNQKRRVWLPPDGDPRLIRFQQEAAARFGLTDGATLPAHLEVSGETGRPSGPVETGGWIVREGEPVLEARDALGVVGVFRFGLPAGAWRPEDRSALPAPPGLSWVRGMTAVLSVERPHGDDSFVLWTWESRSGWKADPPKE